MSALSRLILTSALAGLLAACAPHETTRTTTTTSASTASPSVSAHEAATQRERQRVGAASSKPAAAKPDLSEDTGITACDDYLASYLACHRAAAIFPPNQLQSRYEAMRAGLLRDAKNPDIRPQLAARCNSLASQLRQALHGKTCSEGPAPAATTP
ncbi:hypothetical protein RHOFW104T7_16985 [Rhodanobacter thiooxydans]|uniref:Lipoprotein n=1 Tax=Rhodanobacter thiooxydans TaxID=416169 RepID=A0A154QF49_9GAMM|nr:hypothetical protein [Rhodanobacter thiooxydans]EIM03066.1 hypothetical protein UUA_01190 [Rhodanobacter thiooxydans LCS2]KZC22840.1 hypothetical protein RHOFW104T7_16985 [Rhodanobacter thiooxydans]MCW0200678.1 hypothetical protein [Rhodanobacter thiooxydans]